MANLLRKLIFRSVMVFYATIADDDIGSLKSLHTLFGDVLVKFEQNRMVRTVQNIDLFNKKWLTIFDIELTPFWKMFMWLKQLINA